MEVVIYIYDIYSIYIPRRFLFISGNLISILSIVLIGNLYECSQFKKIFFALSFQILVLFSKFLITTIVRGINPDWIESNTKETTSILSLSSELLMMLFVIIIFVLLKKKYKLMISYELILLLSPAISLIIIIFTPLHELSNGNYYSFISIICLAVLNILNYILVSFYYQQAERTLRLTQLEKISTYQRDKYNQLSSMYKSTRKLIHDTKNHYYMIKNYVEEGKYDELIAYLDLSLDDLENYYCDYTTGNLVIDSLFTNYSSLCSEKGVTFETYINIDSNRIPVNDYELCIIIGNIMDNAITACLKNAVESNYIRTKIIINDKDMFCIHVRNTFNRRDANKDKDIMHGYGLINVKDIVENKNGILYIEKKDEFCVDIIIPIMK